MRLTIAVNAKQSNTDLDLADIVAELLTVIAAAAPERSTVTVTTSNVEIVEQKESFYFGRSLGAYGIVSVCCSGLDEWTPDLATLYDAVNRHDGDLEISNLPNRESAINFYLPRVAVTVIAEKATVGQSSPLRGAETILIVEDRADILELAAIGLEAFGYKVLKAASGDEACERYNGEVDRIDLLLTDIVMPDIDGATVAARFREQRAEMKVLFMSSYTNNRVGGESVPDFSYLQKPYSIEEFGRRIRGMLTAA